MAMIWEGSCEECGAQNIEFFASRAERDAPRKHCEADPESDCQGSIRRYPYASGLAVKWKYGKNDKKGCFMGPSNNIYKTDTTEKSRIAKTRTVVGPSYKGSVQKDRA